MALYIYIYLLTYLLTYITSAFLAEITTIILYSAIHEATETLGKESIRRHKIRYYC